MRASNPQLTILQVAPELNTGGVERTTLDIAKAIAEAGGTALVASAGGRLSDELKRVGGVLIAGSYDSKNPLVIWRNAARLAAIIRERDVRIVHARSRAPAWSALWAARRTGVPFVTTYHGIYNARSAAKRLYNSVMARGDAVIANSQYTADHIRATFPNLQPAITVIPRGIDQAAFTPDDAVALRGAALRKAWGVPEGCALILLPGRLTRWKGGLVFLDALQQLSGQPVFGVMVGDAQGRDGFESELKARIATLGLATRVHYAGHCSDMAAAYAAADIVVSASIEPEAFGRVAVEAQAMGRPVIATALGAARETVLDRETGWLVPAGDASALAHAIQQVQALSPAEKLAKGNQARAHVLKNFTVDAMAQATLALYRKLLTAHART